MLATVKKINVPTNKRMIVTSDVHGHYRHLKNLLKKINFSSNDILFIVGDIIEKGPYSLKTLRYVMELCNNYIVYPLMGNVDALRLVMFDDDSNKGCEGLYKYIRFMEKHWGGCIFSDMCNELGVDIQCISDIPKLKDQIRESYKAEFDFLRALPTMIDTQNFIFVHAGLPSDNIDSFAGTDAFIYLKTDAYMEKGLEFNKYVVVGHWPVTLYNAQIASSNPIISSKQKIISIDGGCGLKRDGQLNALIIPHINSKDFSFEAYDEFSTAYALESQEESKNSINIRYIDRKITILEKGEEFSFVEHKSTGYRLWVLNDFILKFGEDAECDDYTDYRVPVCVGDKLSIVQKTSRGYLVKKDGISGWYHGGIDGIEGLAAEE